MRGAKQNLGNQLFAKSCKVYTRHVPFSNKKHRMPRIYITLQPFSIDKTREQLIIPNKDEKAHQKP
jgi:hypothetical protein